MFTICQCIFFFNNFAAVEILYFNSSGPFKSCKDPRYISQVCTLQMTSRTLTQDTYKLWHWRQHYHV